jgi:hypothetical protein
MAWAGIVDFKRATKGQDRLWVARGGQYHTHALLNGALDGAGAPWRERTFAREQRAIEIDGH